MVANANLPKKLIDALLAAEVYHHDLSNAGKLDSICIAEAMQCLVRYAFCSSFSYPSFTAAVKLAKEKIHQLEFSVNENLILPQKVT